MNYTNREVVRRLKQYDMFLSSLELTNDDLQRERICDQLDKIEKQILLETNTEYEEEYMTLLSEEPKLFSEEKARLRNIISLIEDRKKYLEERKLKHKRITGSLVELTTFLGEDKLLDFKNRLRIIEKYEDNKVKQEKIIKEMKSLDIKISEASRNVKANTRLNESLENKMIKKIDNVLEELNLYSLVDQRSDITKKQESLKYALDMAKDNLKSARSLGDSSYIIECDSLLSEVTIEYSKYNEELNIKKVVSNLIDHYPQYNYVVVNDGSADSTSQICHQEGYNIIDLPVNLGLAGAFQTGLKYADQEGYDCAIQFDADGQHRPEYIEDLLKEIENGYDIVIGSRFVTEKKPFSMRMLGNRMIERAIKFSTGKVLTDPTSGMRLYSKKIIHEFASNINYGPEPDTISFMIKQGASVKDVQVKMDERTAGESYLNLTRSIAYMLRMMLSILFIQNFRKRRKAD